MEYDPAVRASFERAVAELLRERLERLAVLDIISEGVMVYEDTIMEMDRGCEEGSREETGS